jgi:hypothetical protein
MVDEKSIKLSLKYWFVIKFALSSSEHLFKNKAYVFRRSTSTLIPCYPDWLCWLLISWSTWPHISFYFVRTAILKSPLAPPILVQRVPKASKQLRFPELLIKQFVKWFDKLLKNSIEVNYGPSAPKVFSISSQTIVINSLSLNLV